MTFESNKQQWIVQIPGQPDSPVDTFTLSTWAKTRVIRPDTQVVDVESKRTFTASQIPGVFSEKEYLVAVLFSIFLGYFGIDRFYMGQVGIGIGNIFANLLIAVSRNPNEKDELFRFAILGFALTEAIALFALMRAFLILFTF
jgi:F0F1-type ATP synthase membrane subunit c/vacuolar-type H+-ATPase subunit K